MSIINSNLSSLSPSDQATYVKVNLIIKVNNLLRNTSTQLQSIAADVLSNSVGLTPQQVFDAFGTDGASLEQVMRLIDQTLTSINPSFTSALSSQGPVVVNQDGTVSIGATIKSASLKAGVSNRIL